MATLSEGVCDLRDRSAAAVVYERLRPLAGQVDALVVIFSCSGSYGLWCGMLAACLGRWDDAEGLGMARELVRFERLRERMG